MIIKDFVKDGQIDICFESVSCTRVVLEINGNDKDIGYKFELGRPDAEKLYNDLKVMLRADA